MQDRGKAWNALAMVGMTFNTRSLMGAGTSALDRKYRQGLGE